MITPRKLACALALLVTALGLTGPARVAWCDETPPDTLAPPPPSILPPVLVDPTRQALQISEMEGDPTLQVKVSFTAKAQAVPDLLLELQHQSNLSVLATPDALPTNIKVTAFVQELPLSQVLLGLSRLYGVRWAKIDDTTYLMLPTDKGKLETGLLQLGDLGEYTGRFLAALRESPNHLDWPQEITRTVNKQDLKNGATPQFSSLPTKLQSQIRREKEQMAALRLIEIYQAAMEASVDDYILRAEVPLPPKPTEGKPAPLATSPRITVRTNDGRSIASLNVRPSLKPPTDKAPLPNQPTHNIPGPT